jgi:methionine synthase II (cobalamin-independent)
MLVDTVPELPHVPELPGRGPGAETVGRTLALLTDLPAEWGPAGWALTATAGRDARGARALLRDDLDVVEEELDGWTGLLKQQLCGPWTLAASVELRGGRKVLADPGAVRDVVQAMTEAVAAHLAELRRRVPGAALLLQLDEPGLAAVLAGAVPTQSGLGSLPTVEPTAAEDALRALLAAVPDGVATVGHCCAAAPPVGLLARAGFSALSLDETVLTPADDDAVAEVVDGGAGLLLGVADATPDALASVVRERWRRTGQPAERVTEVAVTPPCGLPTGDLAAARDALARCRAAARVLVDDPIGSEPGAKP